MIIQLDRSCSVDDVIDAFAVAASHLKDWETEIIIGEPVQNATGLVSRKGIRAYSTYKQKMYWFFGPMVRLRGGLHFTLKPLLVDSEYKEVEVEPYFEYGANADVTERYISNNPDSSEFSPARPCWDDFMKAFFEELGRV